MIRFFQDAFAFVKKDFRLSKEFRQSFLRFYAKESPLEATILWMLALDLMVLFLIFNTLRVDEAREDRFMSILSISAGTVTLLFSTISMLMKYKLKRAEENTPDIYFSIANIVLDIFVLSVSVFLCLRFYARVEHGKCENDGASYHVFCNPNADVGGLPEDALVFVILVPLASAIILRETHLRVIVAAYSLLICLTSVTVARDKIRSERLVTVVVLVVLSAIIVYSHQKQNVRTFVAQQQLSAVIKQNEEMAEELRANELRHMIGNVAHDLKTPLASFVSGLDMIADIAQDELNKITGVKKSPKSGSSSHDQSPTSSSQQLKATAGIRDHSSKPSTPKNSPPPEILAVAPLSIPSGSMLSNSQTKEIVACLKAVLSTVQNNRNINNFMMMTINRCIDYTKASRGLKLVPKYETVDLLETLYLPFKCMGDVSQKVRISLEPLSSAICSHVITDKQWLQENVLCLLSNAVKYSAGGTVNGRMLLTTAEAVGPGARCNNTSMTMQRTVSEDSMISLTSSANILDVACNPHASRSMRGRQVRSTVNPTENDGVEEIDVQREVVETRKPNSSQEVLLVEIEDTGIGMTDEAMANLFDAFKRAQKFAGGTGLGLFSLAKRIEALGGVYGVRRRDDGVQGSLFWFTMPYRPDEQFATLVRESSAFREIEMRRRDMQLILEDVSSSKVLLSAPHSHEAEGSPRGAASSSTIPSSVPSKGLKILIVDDSASIQKMMSMMLRRHGHEVDQAENGAAAVSLVQAAYKDSREKMVEKLEEAQQGSGKGRGIRWQELIRTPYDVVLMDLQMPVMDGLEAMGRIRTMERQLILDIVQICSDVPIDALFAADDVSLFDREVDEDGEVKADGRGHEKRGSLHLDFNNNNTNKHALQEKLIRKISSKLFSSRQLEDIQAMLANTCHQLMLGVSANSDTDTMQDALNAGADAFISKPFSIDSFYSTYNKCFHITNRLYTPP